ncbi:uncharacterized protein METZ01_LOCUS157616, partial [marine metagenome]
GEVIRWWGIAGSIGLVSGRAVDCCSDWAHYVISRVLSLLCRGSAMSVGTHGMIMVSVKRVCECTR